MRRALVLSTVLTLAVATAFATDPPCGVYGNVIWPAAVGTDHPDSPYVQAGDLNGDGILDVVAIGGSGFSVSLGLGGGSFAPPVLYSLPYAISYYGRIGLADLNGDGRLDVIGAIEDTNTTTPSSVLFTYFNDGNGNLTSHQTVSLPFGHYFNGLAVADFNHDGYADAAVSMDGMLEVAYGAADGSLGTPVYKTNLAPLEHCLGSCQIEMTCADFNHDGYPDLAVSGFGVQVLLGSASGSFTGVYQDIVDSGAAYPGSVAVGDVDGDGWDDIAYHDNQSGLLVIARYNGSAFVPYRSIPLPIVSGENSTILALGDLNGDGHPELVGTSYWRSTYVVDLTAPNPKPVLASYNHSSNIVLKDMNGDGVTDILTGAYYGTGVTSGGSVAKGFLVQWNSGDATFNFEDVYAGRSNNSNGVVLADVNRDTHPDLVTLNIGTAGATQTLSIYLNNGDNTFAWSRNYPVSSASSFAAADMNQDGWPDLVVVGTGALYTLLNQGDGTFGAATSVVLPSSAQNSLAVGDMNGDGYPDVVAAPTTKNRVCVALNNGHGALVTPVSYSDVVAKPNVVKLADVNGDGYLDVVAGHTDTFSTAGNVTVWLGTGTGTLQSPTGYPVETKNGDLAIGDVDEDGHPDIVSAGSYSGARPSLLHGNGNGTFTPYAPIVGPTEGTYALKLVDLSGSGHLDFVRIGWGVTVARGNGDGTFQPPVNFFAGGSASGLAALWDFNGDGRLDIVSVNFIPANGGGVFGDSYTQPTIIYNLSAPSVYSQPQSQAVAVGTTVTLAARVRSAPPTLFQWKKDGVAVVDGGRISGAKSQTLKITGATQADSGAYVLVVDSSCDTASSAVATLTVSVPICRGDANCDHVVNWRDIDYFVAGLNDNQSSWRNRFPGGVPTCDYANLDTSNDGHVTWRDIDPFVRVLNTTCP